MFFQPSVEGAARDAQFPGRVADVALVLLDGFADGGFLDAFEIEVFAVNVVSLNGFRRGEGEVRRLQRAVLVHDDRAFDGVLEFADVSGPGVSFEFFEGAGMQADTGLLVFPAIPVQETADEEREVLAAVPERRQPDFNGVDAVEQVLAEIVPGGKFVDGRIRGAHEPDVDGDGLVGAQTEHRALFEYGEQFRLKRQREVADLIQEERPARRRFKPPRTVFPGVCKGAFFVPEELAFEEGLGDGAEVDVDEDLVRAAGVSMNGARHRVLSRSVVAQDEDVGVGGGDLPYGFEDVAHDRRDGHDAGKLPVQVGVELLLPRAEPGDVEARLAESGRRGQRGEQFLVLPGVEDKVRGALPDGLHGGIDVAERRDEDDHGGRIDIENAPQPVEPFSARRGVLGEVHIQQDHVVGVILQQFGNAFGIGFGVHAPGVLLEKELRGQKHVVVVVDDEDVIE